MLTFISSKFKDQNVNLHQLKVKRLENEIIYKVFGEEKKMKQDKSDN